MGPPRRPLPLHELLADTGQSDAQGRRHDVRTTVFVECASMYRADGPAALRPVGETEFVNGMAAMSASGGYGATRACAGIVGLADLCLGAAVRPVLEAHIDAARALPRHPPCGGLARQRADPQFAPTRSNTCCWTSASAGFAQLAPLGLSFDAWLYHRRSPN